MLAAAAAAGIPAALVAGQVSGPVPDGIEAVTLAALAGGAVPAQASPARWLREAGRRLAGAAPATS